MTMQSQDVMTLQDLLDRKEWGKALTVLDQQVQREPDQRQWRLVRASVLIKSGRVNEGIEGLASLTGLFPDFLDAWINLGQTHKALGNYRAADAAYREALNLQPEHPIATKGAAQCAQAQGDHQLALPLWKKLAKQGSPDPDIWLNMAICQLESYPAGAVESALKAQTLCPERDDICHVLARAYVNAEQFERALPLFERLNAQAQWRAEGVKGKIACLLYLGDCHGALVLLDAFRNTGGSKVDACLMEAKARVQLGDKSSAMAAFRQALAEDRTCVDAWYGLLNTDARSVDGADAAFLENTWHSLVALRDKVLAGFALAHWHEVRANFNEQLHWLDLANEVRRALRPFDRGTLSGWHDLTRRFCTFEWYSRLVLPDALPESVAPILICGMPRSGTTLIEQTLATCESVTSRGENQAHAQAMEMVADNMGNKQLDAFLRNIDRNGVGAFRKYYQRILTEQEGVTTPSFTSKSMDLVFNLGILLAAFPGAKVIHVRRHPLDVGLGCYKQYFAQGQAFSGSWEGIACYYATFQKLMSHWSSIFPESILSVSYEALVSDPEAVTRRIATHCGLDWQSGMLAFQGHKRVVTTASALQVREGLFSSGAGRWAQYGDLLHPLMVAFEREGVDWQSYNNNQGAE